ncbi:glycosyltransferase [Oleiharenicola lentus]|uniref:Glycosyltransferase n=1 Tax=Oleiharenicola lentus TaxID=2508720 RepID=A0A4Q1CA28_9BACT|nr:glycosyltransferase [Oleiharenicola lentus]RXK55702.1 glycosyltransferase [Oleiharenicola lentus]
MSAPSIDVIFPELVARGLLASTPPPQALASGNADRRPDQVRTGWRATRPDGTSVKLTLAASLGRLPQNHAALAAACPAIIPRPCFHERVSGGEVLAEEYFAGTPLDEAVRTRLYTDETILVALATVSRALAATEQPSSEGARQAEWQQWTAELLALPNWQPNERALLTDTLLPALYSALTAAPAATRWTNGDFLPSNLLVGGDGTVRLIDAEFARRTHFFAEDAVRFRVLSSLLRERPDLDLPHALPASPGLVWHLYFWLRQWQLESTHNTAAYLQRVSPARLGLIRTLAERLLKIEMTGWSVSLTKVETRLEEVRWSTERPGVLSLSGWCFPFTYPGPQGVAAIQRDDALWTCSGLIARPDVQQHHQGDARALYTGFSLELDRSCFAQPVELCAVVEQGTLIPFLTLTEADLPRGALDWRDYPAWAARHDPDPPAPVQAAAPGPLFSVLLPVYRPQATDLEACLASVAQQHHGHWELCVVDDASASAEITRILETAAARDPRIRLKVRTENGGISRATNDALALARGEFILLLDHDDRLRPHALSEFAARLRREPEWDALYSDEDKITADGQRVLPLLKPDFSPEFFRGVMYVGHALCVRTTVARDVGGFDPVFDGVQDFEFMLRVSERTRRIGHIPRMLYHWRQAAGSSALSGNIKGNMDEKQARAVQAHLRRIGDPRQAEPAGGHRVRLRVPQPPTHEVFSQDSSDNLPARLRALAERSQAEVIVCHTPDVGWRAPIALAELVALAALPDSGCVAPVLLAKEGLVYEAGAVGPCSLLRGFHAASDGYHGSLRCNREVDAVSPRCIAIKRSLLLSLQTDATAPWLPFLRQLRSRGLFHRVCASAQVEVNQSWRDPQAPTPVPAPAAREFHHPQFSLEGDGYQLAVPPAETPVGRAQLRFNLEQPSDWSRLPRCLIARGWCFSGDGTAIRSVRLRAGDRVLVGVTGLPRPDVKATLPEAPDANTGFEIRGVLPAGSYAVQVEAQLGDGTWHPFFNQPTTISRALLPLWLRGGDWRELMFFQMPGHPVHAPRPLMGENFPSSPAGVPTPKLSLVTPSFNHARFLSETMRSVLEQSGVACDYVVQDGGSSDGSAALIERVATEAGGRRPETGEYITSESDSLLQPPASRLPPPARARLVAWSSEPDSGQADAIAKAFAKTSGEPDDLMAWINSDDFYVPGALRYVVDYFAKHPDVDVIYGHRILVDENSQEIGRWFLPKHDPEVLRLNDFVPQETMFWRRRIWDKVGGINPSFKFAMDWDLLLRFQAAGAKIVRVPYFLACFRIHSAQKTSAQMHSVGQAEITRLRERTFGRPFPPEVLETNPTLLRYLRRSAFIEFLWKLGVRAR